MSTIIACCVLSLFISFSVSIIVFRLLATNYIKTLDNHFDRSLKMLADAIEEMTDKIKQK